MSKLTLRIRLRLARLLSTLLLPAARFGSSDGVLQLDVEAQDGRGLSWALIGAGQRMAILPCSLAVESLLDGSLNRFGVVHPAVWMPPDEWMRRLTSRGLQLLSSN